MTTLQSIFCSNEATLTASSRDSASNWETSWLIRSSPCTTLADACARCESSMESLATSHCARVAASGVRSSCAASAVNRRSCSIDSRIRSKSRLIDSTRGRSSLGRPFTGSGRRSLLGRVSMLCASAHDRRHRPPHADVEHRQQQRQHQQPGTDLAEHQVPDQFIAFAGSLRRPQRCRRSPKSHGSRPAT